MKRSEQAETLDRARQAHHLYSSRWAQRRRNGERPFLLRRAEHPQQWQAWRAYFHHHGLFVLADFLDSKPMQVVPTEWPAEFENPFKRREHNRGQHS
jgi:hypothetical protein